jgi:hypothetical protein
MCTRTTARPVDAPARGSALPVDPVSVVEFGMPASSLNRKASARARKAALARATSRRRRLVDPTTCNVDYSAAQLEFMMAMQAYKQDHCRPYPTCNEVLEVFTALGYEKAAKRRARGR